MMRFGESDLGVSGRLELVATGLPETIVYGSQPSRTNLDHVSRVNVLA